MAILKLHSPDIQCDGCANAIKRALGQLEGVQSVEVELEGKNVTARYAAAQTDEAAIRERLALAGFPAA
ncbi:MAG TPA: heavy-metal-associated domain-containing protein [Chthonomonadaceae bacterium]|nr:heavy-metal-associated domain-containing protein [Chthonomonadaceae bacterium]